MAGSMNQSRAQGTGSIGLGNTGSLPSPTGAQTTGGGGTAGNPPLMTAMPQPIMGQGAGAPPGAPQQPMAAGMGMRPQAMAGSGMGPSMHQQAQAMAQQRMGNPMAAGMGGPQVQNMNQLQQMLQMGQRRQAMMNAARGRR